MTKQQLLEQIDRELLAAHDSAEFWRGQLTLQHYGALKRAAEAALDNAITALAVLQRVKDQVRNG